MFRSKEVWSKKCALQKLRPPKIGSKKFGQNGVSKSWDIADIKYLWWVVVVVCIFMSSSTYVELWLSWVVPISIRLIVAWRFLQHTRRWSKLQDCAEYFSTFVHTWLSHTNNICCVREFILNHTLEITMLYAGIITDTLTSYLLIVSWVGKEDDFAF